MLRRATPTTVTRIALALICLIYALLLIRVLAPAGFHPLVLARISPVFPGERFWDQQPPFAEDVGYDGQFFYYLARDPLLLGGAPTYLDQPAYRYQRLLLPALAHALALGQPPLIGWTLLLVNLLGLALGCWYALRIADHYGASRWWLAPYALNPGFLLGILNDLSEPLALGLCTVACYYYLKGRHWLAAFALAGSLLAREILLVVAIGFAAYELLWNRSIRRFLPYLVPGVVFVVWQLLVLWRIGELPLAFGPTVLALPYVGVAVRLLIILGLLPSSDPAVVTGPLVVLDTVALLAVTLTATIAVAGIWPPRPFRWQLALQGVLVLMLNELVWGPWLNFARPIMLLYLFYLFATFDARRPAAPENSAVVGDVPRSVLSEAGVVGRAGR